MRKQSDFGFAIAPRGVPGGLTRRVALAACLVASGAVSAAAQTWVAQGPGPNTLGQVENITDREVVGAVNAVTPHPTDANILFVGSANGGIWRTGNAMAAVPSWTQLSDAQSSQSIGALEFDPTDAAGKTLVAGFGRFSSFGSGGARTGVLRTTNEGTAWTPLGGGALNGLNITGVAPRGAVIVLSVNFSETAGRTGIWRSTNTGAAWTKVSGTAGTGLPAGPSFDLVGDPANNARLFTNGPNGIYLSTNTGATWSKVSIPAMDTLVASADNVRIAVGAANSVYVAISGAGQLRGVFRSGNGGTTWASMELPSTSEGGIHPGGQAQIHLSLAADRTNPQVVYIGGDRQDDPFPNSIGADDYSGRLFRGDASKPAGSRWAHLTHSKTLGAAGGGTNNKSSPHADSRDMDMAANNVLIEGDDGGVYRRTNPLNNNGDWFSMNGNLQTTEYHAVAWDAVSNIVAGGAQDTGSSEQTASASKKFRSISTADGGVLAVDDLSSATQSIRYSSNQFLGGFRRRGFNAANAPVSTVFPTLTVVGGAAISPQFYTPVQLNAVAPIRLIIGAGNSVYESLNRGDTVREIGPGIVANGFGSDTIAYGAAGNPNVLYVGSGNRIFVRTAASPAPLVQSTTYPGGTVVGVANDPGAPAIAYVADPTRVFRTANSGGSWTNITGSLGTLGPGAIRSIAFSTHSAARALIVGSDNGVFMAPGPAFTAWSRFGLGFPRVPVLHLEYDAKDKVLVAGTLGRGAWTLNLSGAPPAVAGAPGAAPAAVEPSVDAPGRDAAGKPADRKPE